MEREYGDDQAADNFSWAQFHLHEPSEHTVDGNFYDAEIHFVHLAGGNLPMPFGAVFGVFFDRVAGGNTESPLLKSIFDAIEAGSGEINIESLLTNAGSEGFWTYRGSLTTPPCTEGASWAVMKKVQPISEAQYAVIKAALSGKDGNNGKGNNRVVQDLKDRTLYFTAAAPSVTFVAETEEDGATGVTTFAALAMAAIYSMF